MKIAAKGEPMRNVFARVSFAVLLPMSVVVPGCDETANVPQDGGSSDGLQAVECAPNDGGFGLL